MSEPIFVAFATQKGGVGKSTLTTLVASYLYYNEGIEILAVDCDHPQHTLDTYRKHDFTVVAENPYLKKLTHSFFQKFKRKLYRILLTPPEDAVQVAKDYIAEGHEPAVVFFDITGTINNRHIVALLAQMDYIFVPITTETGEMTSSLTFANHVQNKMLTTGNTRLKAVNLVWNKIPSREKTKLCETIDRYAATLGLHSLDTVMVNSTKFAKDGQQVGRTGMFRSTMLPPDKRLMKGTNLEALVTENRNIIKVKPMAKKEENFNADDFIESFREDAMPTFHSVKKTKQGNDSDDTKTENVTDGEKVSKMEIAKEIIDLDLSTAEEKFIRTFVADSEYTSVAKRGRQISVCNEHRRKIQKMLILFSEDTTIAGYIYNVLEEHFKTFDDVIQSLYKKVANTKL